MLSETFISKLAQQIESYPASDVTEIYNATPVHGGSINNCYLLDTDDGPFFLKVNTSGRYPDLFEREASGHLHLKRAGALLVPDVYLVEYLEDKSYLLAQYMEEGRATAAGWEQLGRGLAQLHQTTNDRFGFYEDNYMGSLPQYNQWHSTWPGFFIEQRLKVQVLLAVDKGLLETDLQNAFDRLYNKLPELIPNEPPALVHGDLWSGNFMFTADGKPAIFDPAVYYGNREVDLAMSRLFGGFDRRFYDAYFEMFPVNKGLDERLDIYNLYPLLVHLNLFGRSYLADIRSILKRY